MSNLHAMIDIEAFGNCSNGLIVSIGAVRFDPGAFTAGEQGHIGDPFRVNIRVQDALDHGAKVEGATIKWWFEQEREAQKALYNPEPEKESKALELLASWIHRQPLDGVWAHGINYDLRMLQQAYERYGNRIPWSWRSERDTRTLFSLVPEADIDWRSPTTLVKHDPVGDAIRQCYAVQSAMRLLRHTQSYPAMGHSTRA